MKYIKKLNIDFNDWNEIDEYEVLLSDDNTIKLGDKLHCYKNAHLGIKLVFTKGKWYEVKKDSNFGDDNLVIISNTDDKYLLIDKSFINTFFDKKITRK